MFTVRVADGSIVLTPAVVTNVELYTDERMDEFAKNAALSQEEVAQARKSWSQRASLPRGT